MTEWLRELLMLIAGGLFSATVVTSIMFYRQTRRLKEAEAEKLEAEADDVAYSALSKAVEQLRAENGRLAKRVDCLERNIAALQQQVTEVVEENASLRLELSKVAAENEVLRGRLARLRTVLVDLKRGFTMLVQQLVDAGMEPHYIIPEDVWSLLDEGLGDCDSRESRNDSS